MDKATPTPSPASVDKQAALVAKLRYMGKQYAAGQVARGGSPQKHYLEEAADEIEMMAWALSMNTKTPASAQENADLRNVIQAACIDGLPGLSRAWEKYFPDHPITIKGAEVERLAAQSAPTSKMACEQIRAWHDAYPRMDIYAKPGTLVMFDGRGGYEGEQEAAKKLLTMRGVYAVERVDVFSSSSTVYLAGVKGRGFNTVMFSVAPEPVAAHVASLCADVEPVAFMFQHSETGRIAFVDAWQKENGWATANPRYKEVGALHGASTVAALKAEIEALRKDAERYRWLRDGEIVADYPYPVMRMGGSRVDDQTIWADELDAAIDDAISAAQHPQQEQSK